jgi:hypothetical protein
LEVGHVVLKNFGFVPILSAMHVLLQIGGYLIAAVFIAHVVYFLGCFVLMALCAVASPFVWLWQRAVGR